MATTRIMPIHINKGKTPRQCITERLDYIMNPEKTDGGILISSYACSPETAAEEFMLFRQAYQANTGRSQENEVIAYHIRQAFKPGEITPEGGQRDRERTGIPDDQQSVRLRRCDAHRQAPRPQSHRHLRHSTGLPAQIPGCEKLGEGSCSDQRHAVQGTQSFGHSESAR